MKRAGIKAAAVVVGIFIAGGVAAQKNGPCFDDRASLCPNAMTRRQAHLCLLEHKDKIRNPECITEISSWFLWEATVPGCMEDSKKFCVGEHAPNVKTAEALIQCLKVNKGKISDNCRKALLDPCTLDRSTTCAEAEFGNELNHCMKDNLKKLSAGCRAIIARSPPLPHL